MTAIRSKIVAYLGAGLLAAGYVAASCGSPVAPDAPAGETYSPRSSSGTLVAASALAPSGSDASGPCAASAPDDYGLWMPPTDGCYQPTAWPASGCAVDVAIDPSLGAPPLKW